MARARSAATRGHRASSTVSFRQAAVTNPPPHTRGDTRRAIVARLRQEASVPGPFPMRAHAETLKRRALSSPPSTCDVPSTPAPNIECQVSGTGRWAVAGSLSHNVTQRRLAAQAHTAREHDTRLSIICVLSNSVLSGDSVLSGNSVLSACTVHASALEHAHARARARARTRARTPCPRAGCRRGGAGEQGQSRGCTRPSCGHRESTAGTGCPCQRTPAVSRFTFRG